METRTGRQQNLEKVGSLDSVLSTTHLDGDFGKVVGVTDTRSHVKLEVAAVLEHVVPQSDVVHVTLAEQLLQKDRVHRRVEFFSKILHEARVTKLSHDRQRVTVRDWFMVHLGAIQVLRNTFFLGI